MASTACVPAGTTWRAGGTVERLPAPAVGPIRRVVNHRWVGHSWSDLDGCRSAGPAVAWRAERNLTGGSALPVTSRFTADAHGSRRRRGRFARGSEACRSRCRRSGPHEAMRDRALEVADAHQAGVTTAREPSGCRLAHPAGRTAGERPICGCSAWIGKPEATSRPPRGHGSGTAGEVEAPLEVTDAHRAGVTTAGGRPGRSMAHAAGRTTPERPIRACSAWIQESRAT